MNIQGLDYNTQRKKLLLTEYGREIQRMVEHAMTIQNRGERQLCAETIINTMQLMTPQYNGPEKERKLWDHLAVMSDFRLDIDYPFDIQQAHDFNEKPEPVPYSVQKNPVRHYGSLLFELFDKLKVMEPGEERNRLITFTANQMKRSLMTWSNGAVNNEKVADDLARYTDGVIQLDLETFKFDKVSALPQNQDKKKKRK